MKRIIFLFCLWVGTLNAYQYELAVCAIVKDCAPFLKEWIEFHLLVGVEHFYLYDNSSTDNSQEVLLPYIQQGIITLIDWPNQKEEEWRDHKFAWVYTTQVSAYNHCKQIALGEAKWVAFIDSDEFIVPVVTDKITHFLREKEEKGAISIYWQMYGTSLIDDIPPKTLMIELLTMRGKGECPTTKVIVKPEDLHYFANSPHWCYVYPPKEVYQCSINEMKINHYVNRTVNFLLNQKWKVVNTMYNINQTKKSAEQIINQWNEVEDRTMDRFIPQLREIMEFN